MIGYQDDWKESQAFRGSEKAFLITVECLLERAVLNL